MTEQTQNQPGLFGFQKWETTFKGKTVTMEIRPLKTREMAVVLPLSRMIAEKFKDLKKDTKDLTTDDPNQLSDKIKIVFEDPKQIQVVFDMQEKAADILPHAVRNIVGLKHGWKEICEEFYYMTFAVALLMKLISISVMDEKTTKN